MSASDVTEASCHEVTLGRRGEPAPGHPCAYLGNEVGHRFGRVWWHAWEPPSILIQRPL
jgi:hypothetical protein